MKRVKKIFSDYESCDLDRKYFTNEVQELLKKLTIEKNVIAIKYFVEQLEKMPNSILVDNQSIVSAVKLKDASISKEIVSLLSRLYRKDSRFYSEAVRVAIKGSKVDIAEILISIAPKDFKNKCLSYIITQSSRKNNVDSLALMKLFHACMKMDADYSDNDKLYNQALRENSKLFIKYYVNNHPNKVINNPDSFGYFCSKISSSNELITLLLKTGIDLSAIRSDSWLNILMSRHKALSEDFELCEDNNITFLLSRNILKKALSDATLDSFLKNISFKLGNLKDKSINEVNTLVWLLKEDLIDSNLVINKFSKVFHCELLTKEDKINFLWQKSLESNHTKMSALCCILSFRCGLIKEFSEKCETDVKCVTILLHTLRGAHDVEPLELLEYLPDYTDVIFEMMI
jgi:hypothetical protein